MALRVGKGRKRRTVVAAVTPPSGAVWNDALSWNDSSNWSE